MTIIVYNQGTVDMSNIEVTDYVPTDMIFVAGLDFPSKSSSYDSKFRLKEQVRP